VVPIGYEEPAGDTYYTATEAAAKLGLTGQRVRQLCAKGELKGRKVDGEWRVSKQAVHDRLAARPPRRKGNGAEALDEQRRTTREFAEDNRRLDGELERTRAALDAVRRKSENAVQKAAELERELEEQRRKSETHRRDAEESARDVSLLEAKVGRLEVRLREHAPRNTALGEYRPRLGKGPEEGGGRRRREPPPEKRDR